MTWSGYIPDLVVFLVFGRGLVAERAVQPGDCFVLLCIVVGAPLVDLLTGRHASVSTVLPVAVVVAIGNTGTATSAR
jgi:hypothetical protein